MISLSLEPAPFRTLPYRMAARGSGLLPFIRGRLRGLAAPPSGGALVATSDLQGRETGGERLLGEVAAETLAALSRSGAIPPIGLCLLGGDLYAAPDAARRGASGDATDAFNAFAAVAPTIGVLGNHDRIDPARLSDGVRLLDGDQATFGALTIGGAAGIIGRASKPLRRPAEDYLATLAAAAEGADLLLSHQGPDDPRRGEIGAAEIRAQLERRGAGLHLFGHARWSEPTARIGGWSVLNLDARLYILTVEP